MLKFLFFILLIFVLIFVVVGVLFGRFLKFLKNPGGKYEKEVNEKPNKYRKDDDVIYNKDDVVILKGESKKNKDNKK